MKKGKRKRLEMRMKKEERGKIKIKLRIKKEEKGKKK
jgi:hypothetical protein